MVRPITDAELDAYWANGVVKLPRLIESDQVAEVLAALERQLDNPSELLLTGTHQSDRCFGLDDPTLQAYLTNPVLGESAARAMRSSTARFYFDHVFAFEPDSALPDHYWHQDQPYWPIEGEHIVSFWLSLVRCTPETSALKFVPGTHRNDRFYRPKGFDGTPLEQDLGPLGERAVDASDQFRDGPPPPFHEDPVAHGVVEFSYEPGDAVMFHSKIVHSSGGNNSPDLRRIAYSTRYIGDDARFTLRQGVFQDPALLPNEDEPFVVGAKVASRSWPEVYRS